MLKMRAMIVPEPGGRFRKEERDLPEPGRHEVRIRVHACGVCHSDSITVEGHMPGLSYPRIPGHEVIGVIDAVGPNVEGWDVGVRVGVRPASGWRNSRPPTLCSGTQVCI
jgi:alcohol dehydrogenase